MRAGLMRDRVTFLCPIRTETDFSVNEPTYKKAFTVWARIQHKSGVREVSADMLVNTPKVLFTVRNQVKVAYGMLIEYNCIRYVILDIDDTTERGALRITAEVKHD